MTNRKAGRTVASKGCKQGDDFHQDLERKVSIKHKNVNEMYDHTNHVDLNRIRVSNLEENYCNKIDIRVRNRRVFLKIHF